MPTAKRNTVFAEVVGREIKKWAKAHYKYKNTKILCRDLELSRTDWSRYLNGARTMPGRIVDRLIKLGFSERTFTEYYSKQFDKEIPDNLSKDEFIRLILEYQRLLDNYKRLYFETVERISKYQRYEEEDKKTIASLTRQLEKLQTANSDDLAKKQK